MHALFLYGATGCRSLRCLGLEDEEEDRRCDETHASCERTAEEENHSNEYDERA